MKKSGEKLTFRDFYVEIDLQIVLSHRKIKEIVQVPNHGMAGEKDGFY